MKTFKDLVFKPHPLIKGEQAKIELPDGTKISVICGNGFFYCGEGTYEMMSDRIRINSGVRGWLSPKKITEHMIYVQKNPLKTNKT
jgi:hypothetical protein